MCSSVIALVFLSSCASWKASNDLKDSQVTMARSVDVQEPSLMARSVDGVAVKKLSREEFIAAGYNKVYSSCTNYFDALIALQNHTETNSELLNAAGTAATTIMGLAKAYSPTVGIVSAGFGLISNSLGSFNKNELITPYPSETKSLILDALNVYEQANPVDKVTTDGGAILRVYKYAELCTYTGITRYAKEALIKTKSKPDDTSKKYTTTSSPGNELSNDATKLSNDVEKSAEKSGKTPSAIKASGVAAGIALDAGASKDAALAAGEAAGKAANTPEATPTTISQATTKAAISAGAPAAAAAAAGAAASVASLGGDASDIGIAANTASAAANAGASPIAATASGVAAGDAATSGALPTDVRVAATSAATNAGATKDAAVAAGAVAETGTAEKNAPSTTLTSDSITTVSPN